MGIQAVERAILAEARDVDKNPKLRLKDILEWRSGDDLKPENVETERVIYLPVLGVSVCLPKK